MPRQLISRYTQKGDLVLEFFSGSGTTLYECEELKRKYIGFDINADIVDYTHRQMHGTELDYRLHLQDVTTAEVCSFIRQDLQELGRPYVDFFIAHPPYLDIVKFTDLPQDLSQIGDVDTFLDKLVPALGYGIEYLARGKYFAVVMGDVYRNREVVPLSFYLMDAIKKSFPVLLKGIITKNIEGNRGKLGVQNIWRYRALRSDYFLFKHEYIFVFKKL